MHMRKLFWQVVNGKEKYHLVKWKTICRSKKGGLGVTDIRKQNIKWWKLEMQNGLWQTIVRANQETNILFSRWKVDLMILLAGTVWWMLRKFIFLVDWSSCGLVLWFVFGKALGWIILLWCTLSPYCMTSAKFPISLSNNVLRMVLIFLFEEDFIRI